MHASPKCLSERRIIESAARSSASFTSCAASTKDVDAWFTEPALLRERARLVAEEIGLPED
jgi:hypothetical protein